MKNPKQKVINFSILCVMISILALTDCSNTYTQQSSKNSNKESNIKNTTILGMVRSVEGIKVNISLVKENSSSNDSNKDKSSNSSEKSNTDNKQKIVENPPEKPNSDSEQKPEGNPPEKPNSDSSQQNKVKKNNQSSNMTSPINGSGGASTSNSITYKATGEKKDIEINDESLIHVEKGDLKIDGSLDDITIGAIISIKYDKNGDISNILVKSSSSYTGGSSTGSITLNGKVTSDNKSISSENKTVSSTTSNENAYL